MARDDWEGIHQELSRATQAWSREELQLLLRDLIKEYVVERGLPTGSPAQASTPDLSQMDFSQLIAWLKRHLDLPELNLFSIEGQRVIIDLDGPREIRLERRPELSPPPPIQRGQEPPPRNPPPPRREPSEAEPPKQSVEKKPRLSRGFRGLEFD